MAFALQRLCTPFGRFAAVRCLSLSSSALNGRLYTQKHEWVRVESGAKAKVGISEFAQEALGDVVFVELPEVGTVLARGDTAGAIESVKAASDVYAPVTGTVTARNDVVEETPTLINKSPYEKGWLYEVEMKNADELKDLMDEAAYAQFRAQENDEES